MTHGTMSLKLQEEVEQKLCLYVSPHK